MSSLRVLAFGLVVLSADALRQHRKASKVSKTSRSDPAMVDQLYTFGAPGSARPGFVNAHATDGCFPGVRVWNYMVDRGLFGREREVVDQVVPLAGLLGYRHPKMGGAGLHLNESRAEFAECSEALMNEPRGGGSTELHEVSEYISQVKMINDMVLNMTRLGTEFSYGGVGDVEFVAEAVKEMGWRLVGQGYDDGSGNLAGGGQVSNLFQRPSTLECILTFQGSSSAGDWIANLDAVAREFCGRSERAHGGFRNHLRRITRNPSWQSEVRPHLGKCGKVYVAGHSLGGAMAELFTACAANPPAAGEEASEDYSFISWVKEEPTQLPYL